MIDSQIPIPQARIRILHVALLLCLSAPALTSANPVPVGPEIRVNTVRRKGSSTTVSFDRLWRKSRARESSEFFVESRRENRRRFGNRRGFPTKVRRKRRARSAMRLLPQTVEPSTLKTII